MTFNDTLIVFDVMCDHNIVSLGKETPMLRLFTIYIVEYPNSTGILKLYR